MRLRDTDQVIALGAFNGIGRHPSNDIQILDAHVSSHHASISQRGDDFVLLDIGSMNGTYLNRELLAGEAVLRANDVITIGDVQMRFVSAEADQIDDEALARLTRDLDLVVVRPQERARAQVCEDPRADVWAENEVLHKFEAAVRAVLACTKVTMLMDVLLIATEEIGGAKSSRIKLRHGSGAITEKTRGQSPPAESERPHGSRSGVVRITRHAQSSKTEVAIPITGRGATDGALWLTVEGQLRHLEHQLLRTLCDVASTMLATLEAR